MIETIYPAGDPLQINLCERFLIKTDFRASLVWEMDLSGFIQGNIGLRCMDISSSNEGIKTLLNLNRPLAAIEPHEVVFTC